MRTLVVATGNPGKAREFERLLAGLPVRLVTLRDVAVASPAETGGTFAENAVLKARHAAAASGLVALADDSGLEVDALDGAPGIYSARYAGEAANDEENRRRLRRELAGVLDERRTGRFRCALALAAPDGASSRLVTVVEGVLEGRLLIEPRGDGGFGYDPLFLLPERGVTLAELTPEEKNAVSHRARAVRRVLPALRALLGTANDHESTRS